MDASLNDDEEEVRHLFCEEIPEVASDVIEIKGIARKKGRRTLVAVHSSDPHIDPVGACVGLQGTRIKTIVKQLAQEKIGIVRWSESTEAFICNALAPAKIKRVVTDPAIAQVIVYASSKERSLIMDSDRGLWVSLCSQLVGREIRVFAL
jgi:N utilization substance protein A